MELHVFSPARRSPRAQQRCRVVVAALALGAWALPVAAQTLAEKAKESGCINRPKVVEGSTYRCSTASGASAYFNVPPAGPEPAPVGPDATRPAPPRRANATAPAPPSPSGFPRVDAGTQRGRDDMRRKVLGDELASEEKLLGDARTAYANGAPPATADERANPQKYAERIGKLRQAVQLHERNIEALRKELGNVR